MTTAKRIFESKMLSEKYGVLGKVAGRYIKAGYSIRGVDLEERSFIAARRGEKLLVKVIWNVNKIDDSMLDELKNKAKTLNAKPLLIVYGAKPRVSAIRSIIDSIKAREISFRRIKP
ncbi:MAG: hypothetical protein F7C81_03825 [Desulfurococcales archaeon]|nr:hypothetical protein [Desulfurococcales archaeon]